MALPVPGSAAGPREDIVRLLAETPEGLSDGELARALAARHPDLNAKAVNHQCRKLAAAGLVERVGRRPVRTRLLATVDAALAEGVPAAQADPPHDRDAATPSRPSATPALSAVQHDILRALAAAPEGLTDNALGEALAAAHPAADPKSFNYQCRKLAKIGLVERTERAKDVAIRTLLTADGARHLTETDRARAETDDGSSASVEGSPHEEATPGVGHRNGTGIRSRRPRPRAKTPADDLARMRRSERDGDDPDDPPLRYLPFAPGASARTALHERMAERAVLRREAEPSDEVVVPTRDVLQGWSRTQNVAAAVAHWISRTGGVIHAAGASGPAHDLVATVHGENLHVEVTGWPPDGARSHPTTLAGDWFDAATRAATRRRRADPETRVVIALPDTRRYRTLTGEHAAVLRRARTEVWFVHPSGELDRP